MSILADHLDLGTRAVKDWIRTQTRLQLIMRLKERLDRGLGRNNSEYVRRDWEEARALFCGLKGVGCERFFYHASLVSDLR